MLMNGLYTQKPCNISGAKWKHWTHMCGGEVEGLEGSSVLKSPPLLSRLS